MNVSIVKLKLNADINLIYSFWAVRQQTKGDKRKIKFVHWKIECNIIKHIKATEHVSFCPIFILTKFLSISQQKPECIEVNRSIVDVLLVLADERKKMNNFKCFCHFQSWPFMMKSRFSVSSIWILFAIVLVTIVCRKLKFHTKEKKRNKTERMYKQTDEWMNKSQKGNKKRRNL